MIRRAAAARSGASKARAGPERLPRNLRSAGCFATVGVIESFGALAHAKPECYPFKHVYTICLARTRGDLPVISRFYGIVVFLNYNDHSPPHFHARYQDQEVLIEIQSGAVTGSMSKRALQMLLEWTDLHREALMANWIRAQERKTLQPVPPLP